MLKKIAITLAILALAAPSFALVVTKDGQTLPQNNTPAGQPMGTRADVEYSTGGAMNTPATLSGNASGWGYYFVHVYTNNSGFDISLLDLGFPTNENSADPIAMPVDWVVALDNSDPFTIPDPYSYAWDGIGQFTPTGVIDTAPPADYSTIDISGESLVLVAGQSMVWGYENAGLGGMIDDNGVPTYAFYVGAWDPDQNYGRTALLQFTGDYLTTATDNSTISEIKGRY